MLRLSPLIFATMACQSNEKETKSWDLNTYTISWADASLKIDSDSGQNLFESPESVSAVSWGVGETNVEYGSGSFTFADDDPEWCGDVQLAFNEGNDEQLSVMASSENCAQQAELLFEIKGDGRVGLNIIAPSAVNRIELHGTSHKEERFLGFGAQAAQINMKGKKLPIWCQEQGHGRGAEPLTSVLGAREGNPAGEWHNSYTCVPWTFTDSGWGMLVENNERVIFDLTEDNRYGVSTWSNTLRTQFVEGNSPAEMLTRATDVFGRMETLPNWTQQGAIIRAHGGAESVLQTAQEALSSGVPITGIWIEDWCGLRDTALGSRMWWNWTIDRGKYPEWENLVAELDAMGFATLAYLNPYLADSAEHSGAEENLFAIAQSQDFLVKNEDGSVFFMDQGGFEAALIDLSNPDAEAWLTQIVEDLIATGVKGWMADFAEGLPLGVTLAGGSANVWHNKWPEKWAEINQTALSNSGSSDHFVFHRSGNQYSPGKAKAFWIGDQTVTWDANDGLASVTPLLLSSGLSGYTMQHADTGGYLSVELVDVTRDAELFQRWVELNAMTPVFRMHSTNQPEANHQWNTDEETISHLGRFATLFKELAPTRATLMVEASEKGWPLIRPLFFHHGDDSETWEIDDQFMLGPDLIMAPVTTQGAVERQLYLPEGEWIHGPSQAVFAGPGWITVDAPIGSPPIFGKKDTAAAASLLSLSLQ